MSAIWIYLLGLLVAVLVVGFCVPDTPRKQH